MLRALAVTGLVVAWSAAQALTLPLDVPGEGWNGVTIVADGVRGAAARFAAPTARIDAGPLPITSSESFALSGFIRTRSPEFATVLIARDGEEVGVSIVVGRSPGRLSFEAWSWRNVKLLSRGRVDDGRWHAFEVSYDAGSRTAALYVDDSLQAFSSLGAGQARGAQLRLGNNIGCEQPFTGDLDEIRFDRKSSRPSIHALAAPIAGEEASGAALGELRSRILERPGKTYASLAKDEWLSRRTVVRRDLSDALGLVPEPARGPLDFIVHGEMEEQGCRVQRVSWNGWPGTRATGWMWLPMKIEGRLPAVLHPHGHWPDGAIDGVVQARARRFARVGYVSLVVDSVHVEDVAAGLSSIGVMTWNNVRALDLLCARTDVDPARIGVTGASGGGQQTMYLIALDDRPAAAAPICMVSEFSTIVEHGFAHCGCNHVARVGFITDQPEMCAMFAPKPLVIGTVTGDWTKTFPSVTRPKLAAIYATLGNPEAFQSRHLAAGHNYDRAFREMVYAFFDEHVAGVTRDATEPAAATTSIHELRALGPPQPSLDRATLARELRARRPRIADLRAAAPSLPWAPRKRELVPANAAASAGAEWARFVARAAEFASGDPLPVLIRDRKPDSEWVVVSSLQGKLALATSPPSWMKDLDRVALYDPHLVGESAAFLGGWRRNGILLGCGEGYMLAQDLADVVTSLPGTGRVTVVALGQAGPSALIAAQFTPRIGSLVIENLGPTFASDGNRIPLCPEILRFGDLAELVAAAGRRRIVLGGAPADSGLPPTAPLTPEAVGAALATTESRPPR